MFRSILVPLDGSPFSERALPLAEMVGRGDDVRLYVVSVDGGDPDRADYLQSVVQRLEGSGLDAQHAVLEGKVADALEGFARDVEADLIVMATHGRKGLDRLRLGSVAEGLVTRGIAPILLYHPGPEGESEAPKELERVVIALDHSAFAQSILEPVEALGRTAGVSSYTIVHVAESRGVGKAGWTPIATVQARANERVAPIRERLSASGAEVDIQVVMAAEPADGILGVAEQSRADLIAMTTHGMTGVRPTLVGSVAAQVLRKWHGAVLLRRPED